MSHDSGHHKHGMHSKHEMKEKLKAHRHKVPAYLARELARTDVPKEIAKTAHNGKASSGTNATSGTHPPYGYTTEEYKKH